MHICTNLTPRPIVSKLSVRAPWGTTVRHCVNYQVQIDQFQLVPFKHVTSFRNWLFGSCCDKQQLPCENQCETANESVSVQSDAKH